MLGYDAAKNRRERFAIVQLLRVDIMLLRLRKSDGLLFHFLPLVLVVLGYNRVVFSGRQGVAK